MKIIFSSPTLRLHHERIRFVKDMAYRKKDKLCAGQIVLTPSPPPGTPGDITFFVVAPGFLSP